MESGFGIEAVSAVGEERGVQDCRERQIMRETKFGVEGEDVGVVGVEREGEDEGEIESFIAWGGRLC